MNRNIALGLGAVAVSGALAWWWLRRRRRSCCAACAEHAHDEQPAAATADVAVFAPVASGSSWAQPGEVLSSGGCGGCGGGTDTVTTLPVPVAPNPTAPASYGVGGVDRSQILSIARPSW